uniref:Uncharacterized protein n=1 Tax=viral metagenome TaxID=1070528 RepID=A0A6C0AKX4_9ZZZZ
MGNCFGFEDTPMMTIGTKTVRKSQMKGIKTYQDALRFMGRECSDTAVITIILNHQVSFVPVSAPFQIVDEIIFKQSHIPTRKLYGRRK